METNKIKEGYTPFGDEWIAECKKLNKDTLIDLLAEANKKRIQTTIDMSNQLDFSQQEVLHLKEENERLNKQMSDSLKLYECQNQTIIKLQSQLSEMAKALGEEKQKSNNYRNLLEDVVNELDLSESTIEEHGPLGSEPSKLVRLVLEEKNRTIRMLKQGFKQIDESNYNKSQEGGKDGERV